ncbi:hypothetical protein BCR44DRAFT_55672 [Catenaria anguillulae PL171]|uniref:Uncharacterized protein n=1 Tax=Catenaria anguillulae PL171 TaxID=765915 RepID=A0A1Y2HYW2_9FUNG|nr:hypothetical protein BCR44DRAFT_55672 [Catenaria anguillulae PL171]
MITSPSQAFAVSVSESDAPAHGSQAKSHCHCHHHRHNSWSSLPALATLAAIVSVLLLALCPANATALAQQQSPFPIPTPRLTPTPTPTPPSRPLPLPPALSLPVNSTAGEWDDATNSTRRNATVAQPGSGTLITLNSTTSSLALNCSSSQDCPGTPSSTFCHPTLKTCQLARCGLPTLNATLLTCSLFNSSTFCTNLTSGRGTCAPQLPEGAACNPDLENNPQLSSSSSGPLLFRWNVTHLPNVNLTSSARVLTRGLANQQCIGLNYCSPFSRTCAPDPQFMWRFDPNNREGKLSVWAALGIMVGGLVALAGWVALCTSGMIRCSRMYQRDAKVRWFVDRVVGGCCCCCFKGMRKRARRQPVLPIGLGKVQNGKDKEEGLDEDGDGTSSVVSSVVEEQHPMVVMQHLQQQQQQQAPVPFTPPLPPRPTHQQVAAMTVPGSPAPMLQLAPIPAASPLLPQFDAFNQFLHAPSAPPAPAATATPVPVARLSRMEPAIADGVLPPMAPMVGVGASNPGYALPVQPHYVAHQQPVYSPSPSSATATGSSSHGGGVPIPAPVAVQHRPQPRPWNAGKP